MDEDVPANLRNAAIAALRQRQVELVVADLDPIDLDEEHPTAEASRSLSFSTADRHIELVADEPVAAGCRLHIRLDPPAEAAVEVWHPGELITSGRTDDAGVVDLDGVPPGPLSLVCRFSGAANGGVQTSWVTL